MNKSMLRVYADYITFNSITDSDSGTVLNGVR
uniref:Uncharacterized protein n=1 Tax=Siphoviridae sp. ctiOl67 TaxID=2825622 RepID=A0A8S5QI93_9CAUD|nr:MAG TPA: hypothetical protein [Siphoviridae sp. ctiOl67]